MKKPPTKFQVYRHGISLLFCKTRTSRVNVNQSCQNLYPLSIQHDMFIQNEGKFNQIQKCWYFAHDTTILYWQTFFKLGSNYIIYRCIRTLEWSRTVSASWKNEYYSRKIQSLKLTYSCSAWRSMIARWISLWDCWWRKSCTTWDV